MLSFVELNKELISFVSSAEYRSTSLFNSAVDASNSSSKKDSTLSICLFTIS